MNNVKDVIVGKEPMTDKYDDFLYQSGLTAQGCWDELDQYAKDAILKFGDLIVRECAEYADPTYKSYLLKHFKVKE
jgi:hypothetical protein